MTPGENLVVDGVPKIPASLAETAGRYGSYRTATSCGLASDAARDADRHAIWRYAATASGENAGRGAAAAHVLSGFGDARRGFIRTAATTLLFMKDIGGGEWFQLYRYDVEDGRCDAADGREIAKFAGAVVFERGSDRVCFDAADRARHGFVGDESGGPEERSFADAADRRRVAAGGLVAGRQDRFCCWRKCRSTNRICGWWIRRPARRRH